MNQVFFHKNEICTQTQHLILNFIIEQIQIKLISKFFITFKKSYFWPILLILGGKNTFSQKLRLSQSQMDF